MILQSQEKKKRGTKREGRGSISVSIRANRAIWSVQRFDCQNPLRVLAVCGVPSQKESLQLVGT